MHANQGLLEGVEGGGVQHLLLDLGAVRAPIENRDVIEAYKGINIKSYKCLVTRPSGRASASCSTRWFPGIGARTRSHTVRT